MTRHHHPTFDARPRPAVLEPITWLLSIGMLALAAAGVVTQIVAIRTGRDYVFGLIPAFNPSGARNLQVWYSSMALVATALVSAIGAAASSRASPAKARAWWLAAGLLTWLSLHRLAPATGQMSSEALAALGGQYLAWAVAIGGAWLFALGARDLPPGLRTRTLTAMAMVGATLAIVNLAAPLETRGHRLLQAVVVTGGRLLELAGLLLFLRGVVADLTARSNGFHIRASDGHRRTVDLSQEGGALELRLSPAAMQRRLAILVALLLIASLFASWARTRLGPSAEIAYRFLFVDFEGNLPTWISAVLLLACGAVAAVIAVRAWRTSDAHWRAWGVLALFLVALSADEAASFHELLVTPLRALTGGTRWLRYPLILPGVLVVLAATMAFARLLKSLDAETRRAIRDAAAVFFFGALVMETVGGWFDPVIYGESAIYVVLTTIEEGCEALGSILLLTTLLHHSETLADRIRVPERVHANTLEGAAGS